MGCCDIFCFLCGNTTHSFAISYEDIFNDIVQYEKTKNNKKYKWFNNQIAPLYEMNNSNPKELKNKINTLRKSTKWLEKCTFLTADNRVIHGCSEVSCNIEFRDGKGNGYWQAREGLDQMYGVFVHTDCWKFANAKYKIKLSYGDLPIMDIDPVDVKLFDFIDYGQIEKYWDQDFNFYSMMADNNEKYASSPLKSEFVRKNIGKIISQLKIKNKKERQGPSVSATFYDENTYKVGLNGNIWKISRGKWIEQKSTVKLTVNTIDKKAVYCGEFNTVPLFILSAKFDKKKEFTILTIGN